MIDRVVSQSGFAALRPHCNFMKPDWAGTGCLFTKTFMRVLRLASRKFISNVSKTWTPALPMFSIEHVTLYCWTPSLAGALRQLLTASHQGSIVRDAHDTPWGTKEAILEDPDGHRIYLAETVNA